MKPSDRYYRDRCRRVDMHAPSACYEWHYFYLKGCYADAFGDDTMELLVRNAPSAFSVLYSREHYRWWLRWIMSHETKSALMMEKLKQLP